MRRSILYEIDDLLDNYCEPCDLKKNYTFQKRHQLQVYCNTKCTIGEKLQQLGRRLKLPRRGGSA